MAKIIFITGGAQSGKARWAVNYFEPCDNVAYMCVYDSLERDIADRIAFNCDKHGISWDIMTDADNLAERVKGHKFAILDNLGEYTNRAIRAKCANLAEINAELRREIEVQIIDEIAELIDEVKEIDGTLLIISLELGFCPVPADPAQKAYRKILGNVNQRIANLASEVYLSASGIHFKIK